MDCRNLNFEVKQRDRGGLTTFTRSLQRSNRR